MWSYRRGVARAAAAMAAAELLISLITVFTGGFRLQAGGFHVSSGLWSRPLLQALWLAGAAGLFFYWDARHRAEWDAVPPAMQRWLSGSATEVRQRLLWSALAVAGICSLLVCYRLSRQAIIMGSVDGGWVYGYVHPFSTRPLAIFAAAAGIYGVALAATARLARHEWATVLCWLVAGTATQAVLCSLAPDSFGALFAGDTSNSFFRVTQRYDASAVLADFARLRDTWPVHAHSNMPGKLMLLYALERTSQDPAVLAWLAVALSNLGGVLLYLFVREFFADRRVAVYALALYLVVPGKILFFPVLNTVTPAIVLGLACLILRWLRTGRTAWAAVSGAYCFGLVFFEPMPLVMGLLFALITVRALWRGDLTWTRWLAQTGVFVAAFLAAYVLVRGGTCFDLFDGLRRVGGDAAAFNVMAGRRYDVWIRQDLIDFLFAAGVCQTVLFVPALVDGLRSADGRRPVIFEPLVVVSVGIAAALVVIDVAGVNRGEATRLWIFLACFFQIPAAWVCARVNGARGIALVLAATLLQVALASAMVRFNMP